MSDQTLTQGNNALATQAADNIRILSAAMVEKAKSGHPGGAMGGADYVNILFSEFLEFDPSDPTWPFRDRFFLDPGHMSPMLYSQLALTGHFTLDELKEFRQWGSPTPGHPELDVKRGVENTSGPLGQGHAFGVGAAIAERFLAARFGEWTSHKTYIYISDGGVQEEISQGVARVAGFLGLGNVIMFYDSNDIQLSSKVDDVMNEDTGAKYAAMGWHVQTIEGNNPDEIRKAIQNAKAETGKPSLIIGKTIMGKGARTESGGSFEGEVETHGMPLSKAGASFEATMANLGGDPENPFVIFPEVQAYYDQALTAKKAAAETKKAAQAEWATANPELAAKLDFFLSGNLPEIDWASIEQKPNNATRNSGGAVLAYLHDHVENIVVSSADLSNSDKTQAFLKKTTIFRKGDFHGRFLQAGVSEMTMAALCVGMSLHGGVVPVCATFFAFSDFMKPTLRLAALMEQPVKFVWTHDAFRVGEDGPTHQPIEQEAQLRLLEQLQNHSHKNSFLALRPADANEATIAWKMAIENVDTPSGMILSRQNINDLPGSSYEFALQAEKGAYIVEDSEGTPDLILVANGSEVATLVEGAAKLRAEKGLKVRVVSAISEGRFRDQSAEYQASVLPTSVPTVGLTAGLPVTLRGLVGPLGMVIGLNHFGFSAPYKVLDEKFGYTAENVFNKSVEFLASLNQ
ncbi:transketolase [Pontibacter sp. G13]|uniref:transketolase family protein n=1 Tax=Pontibacter sp. G13 TaxID=3074898 RepID=UPI00288B7AE4|nr:transketolase [Pontibacter sp. G13]WNJ20177.1 transketolase [Pontibacter sp. G13]